MAGVDLGGGSKKGHGKGGKKQKKRISVRIDMTPMVDVIMLLLTFFMLTTQFKPDVLAEVILPVSHSAIKLPESDVITVVVTKDNQLYMELDSQNLRAKLFGEENKLKLGIHQGARGQSQIADGAPER
jgi:biopolymer transport protein ExbD